MVWGLDTHVLLSKRTNRFCGTWQRALKASIRSYQMFAGFADTGPKNAQLSLPNSSKVFIHPITFDSDTIQGVSNDLGNSNIDKTSICSGKDPGE